MKYSLPPSKRLVMTLTAKDNGGFLTLLHCLEDLRNMLKSTGKKNSKNKNTALQIKAVKDIPKID